MNKELIDRVVSVRNILRSNPDTFYLRWHSSVLDGDYSRLENTYLISAGFHDEEYLAFRIPATIEYNELNQHRVLYSINHLMRIRNGVRCGLIVKPDDLRSDENAVPAGLNKRIMCSSDSDCFFTTRHKDLQFLSQLESMVNSKNVSSEIGTPFYKQAYKIDQLKPRVTGRLIEKLKGCSEYNPALSCEDNFKNCGEILCESTRQDGQLIIDFDLCFGGGLTMCKIGDLKEVSYHIPFNSLDQQTGVFRLEMLDTISYYYY